MPKNNNGGSSNGSSLNSPSPSPIVPSNPSSPYYVNPDENPTDILISPPLNGNNYHSWARAMKRAIVLKSKFGFLDGSIPNPERSDPSFDSRKRCDALVHCWLMNSAIPSIAQIILYAKSAAEVWKELREMFSQRDVIRVYELQQELYSFKQNSLSVTEYFKKLKVIWEELEYYRPIPDCVCAVKCEASRILKVYQQQDYIIQFLRGLNQQFSVVKSQILWMDPLPPLNRVVSMVLEHEWKQGSKGIANGKQRVQQAIPSFTQEEYKKLLGLLQKVNIQKAPDTV